jgi:hypothetical protein
MAVTEGKHFPGASTLARVAQPGRAALYEQVSPQGSHQKKKKSGVFGEPVTA